MIFTHLAFYEFFTGASDPSLTGGSSNLPVLTLYHYFDGYTDSSLAGGTAAGGEYIIIYRRRRY